MNARSFAALLTVLVLATSVQVRRAEAQFGISIGGDSLRIHYYDNDDGHRGYHDNHHGHHDRGSYWGVTISPRHEDDGYQAGERYREDDRDPRYIEPRSVRRANHNDRSFSAAEIDSGSIEENSVTAEGIAYVNDAQLAFRRAEYDEALRSLHHAMIEMPRNGKVHLITSQALFAVGDYAGAAEGLRHAMALLDTEHWGWVVENYPRFYANGDYVKQMNELSAHLKEHLGDGDAFLVRGYHWANLGHEKAARKDYAHAVAAAPEDLAASQLAAQLTDVATSPHATVSDEEGNEDRSL